MKKYEFELLLITDARGTIKTVDGVAHLIATHNELSEFIIKKDHATFKYNNETFFMKVKKPKDNIVKELIFNVLIHSNESDEKNTNICNMEKLRKIITNKLNNEFSGIYIVKDEVSQQLCIECYEYINSVENKLREFILRFMITKIGSDWFQYVVTDSGINKANSRNKKNDEIPFISQDIYNIDFKDLSEIIFNNHTHYKSKNDILKELKQCKTIEDYNKVREKAESNWDSYFNEYFDENWRDKWNNLSEYRNIIAHNKVISQKTVDNLKDLSNCLLNKIENAIEQLKNFHYSEEESITISNTIIKLRNKKNEELKKYLEYYDINEEILNSIVDECFKESISEKDVEEITSKIIKKYNLGNETKISELVNLVILWSNTTKNKNNYQIYSSLSNRLLSNYCINNYIREIEAKALNLDNEVK